MLSYMKTLPLVVVVLMVAPSCVGQADGPGGGSSVDGGAGDVDASGNETDANPNAPDARPGATDAGTSQAECYTEVANPNADITDLVASYGGANWKDELIAVMTRRHPATAFLLNAQRNDSYFSQFSDSNSWTGMVGWLDTLSHEETHLFNAYHAQSVGKTSSVFFREDLILYPPTISTFARSEIHDDIAQSARDGIYASTYLTGSSGERGFEALVDEQSCYLNELAAVGLVGEHFNGGVSLRDGSVAFLYFMQVYLRVARTEYPAIYNQLKGSEVYREIVKTQWLRTHYFLPYADAFPNLGINDGTYRTLMHQPENMAEISMFIGQTVNASNCVQTQ